MKDLMELTRVSRLFTYLRDTGLAAGQQAHLSTCQGWDRTQLQAISRDAPTCGDLLLLSSSNLHCSLCTESKASGGCI